VGKFSRKAKTKAARNRAKSYLSDPRLKGGPVKVSYLPGFAPPSPTPPAGPSQQTRFPFRATINGREAVVSRNAYGIQIDYPTGGADGNEGLRL